MSSVNKVILIGNLGGDPEIRSFQNGGKIASLSLATSEKWRDKNTGDQRERTEWHKVVIFNENLVRLAEQYLRKGSKVYLEGQIETRKWQDKEGHDRYSTEVVLRPFKSSMTFLSPPPEDSGRRDQPTGGFGGGHGSGGGTDIDDEIPFAPEFR